MRLHSVEKVEELDSVKSKWDIDGAYIVIGNTARERTCDPRDREMTLIDQVLFGFVRGAITVRTRYAGHVPGRLQILWRKDCLAGVALINLARF
jgi:hypothetical protein